MSLAPCGQLLVETRKEYHASRRKESETDKADAQKKPEAQARTLKFGAEFSEEAGHQE